jgi:protein arginine kinase activator
MDEEQKTEESEKGLPERPLECGGECRRPIKVIYTEIVGKNITKTAMCGECPVLKHKLHGGGAVKQVAGAPPAELVCGGCGLTLDEMKMGASLGCPLCYDIFSDEILRELAQLERIPLKYAFQKRGEPLHVGRTPGQHQEIDPSLKLLALQQALHETLGKEDYEQAALLRDQIREIEEKTKKKEEEHHGGPSN